MSGNESSGITQPLGPALPGGRGMTGLDVVFKLSQRDMIDVPNWDRDAARHETSSSTCRPH